MSKHNPIGLYGFTTVISLSKASVLGDTCAMANLRESERMLESEQDCVQLLDMDEHTALLTLNFTVHMRRWSSTEAIIQMMAAMTPHATAPFQVSGANEISGAFSELMQPQRESCDA